MKLLVTGKQGQIARSLQHVLKDEAGVEAVFTGREMLDLVDAASIDRTVKQVKPDIIISAAAYTQVDEAEDNPGQALLVNGDGPAHLAAAACGVGAKIIHLSTDYVFDGKQAGAYREDAPVNPVTVYGKSKLEGENAIRLALDDHVILRTAWVFSPYGKNFMKTILKRAGSGDDLNVVCDQTGNPTSALDIARAIFAIVLATRDGSGRWGETYHFAGPEQMAWDQFARMIMEVSANNGGVSVPVNSVSSSQYRTKATRPANSSLDSGKFHAHYEYKARPVRPAIEEVLSGLKN